jgi:hypothetical protein
MQPMSRIFMAAALAGALAVAGVGVGSARADVVFQQNFDAVPLGPNQEETIPGDNVWTDAMPPGWTVDRTSVPGYNNPPENNGVKEWIGWNIADRAWWTLAAEDQTRSQFTKSTGAALIADPDEWDDAAHPDKPNYTELYDTLATTPAITLANLVRTSVRVKFDSSWRPEGMDDGADVNNQTATVEVVYSNGTTTKILEWDSASGSPTFHPDSQNESIDLPLTDIPAAATSFQLRFGLGKAANDWWWAVDNVVVEATPIPEPAAGGLLLLGTTSVFLRRRRRA